MFITQGHKLRNETTHAQFDVEAGANVLQLQGRRFSRVFQKNSDKIFIILRVIRRSV